MGGKRLGVSVIVMTIAGIVLGWVRRKRLGVWDQVMRKDWREWKWEVDHMAVN
jgi:hypothetical protein